MVGPVRTSDPDPGSGGLLPFPTGEMDENGEHKVRHFSLVKMPRRELQEWCREFSLPRSGNVPVLKERLVHFSASRKDWDSLLPATCISHKGPHPTSSSANIKATKRSVQRRAVLLLGADALGSTSGAIKHTLPTERSTDKRTAAEINMILPWAARIQALLPYRPPAASSPTPLPPIPDHPPLAAANPATSLLHERLDRTESTLSQILHCVSINATTCESDTAMVVDGIHPEKDHGTIPPGNAMMAVDCTSLAAMGNNHGLRARSLQLGNGTTIMFTEDDVPNPPLMTFAHDIARLNRIWDDTSTFWTPTDAIFFVKGQAIALMYLPELYRRWKGQQWDGLKKLYSELKPLIERYRLGTAEDFWREFSQDGKQLPYSRIIKALRDQRKEDNMRRVQEVQLIYGDSFGVHFSYLKNGKAVVMTAPSEIVKRYRELQAGSA